MKKLFALRGVSGNLLKQIMAVVFLTPTTRNTKNTRAAARRKLTSWLALAIAFLLLPQMLGAQEVSGPPTPDDVPELTGEIGEIGELGEIGEQWIEPVSYQGHTHYGTMSDWDLYAGSVYANTSPLWVHAEGLLWWLRGNELPALVTTSPNGTPRVDAGVLGAGNTSIVFGDERVDDGLRGGFRTSMGIRLGHWYDHLMDSELQFDLIWVGDGQSSGDFYGVSNGDPILARPFYNVELDMPDAQLVAFPSVVEGDISIQTSSDFLSTGVLFRRAWRNSDRARIDWLAGYRYAQLREKLFIEEQLVSTDPGGVVAVGTTFDLYDDFRTWNEFHGADVGLQLWTNMHGWTVEVMGKLALGANIRTVEIDGQTFVQPPAAAGSLAQGGLLAMPTNMGRYQSSRFSVLPEMTVRLRRPISRFFTFTAGYTVLVLNNVVRTGDQIDVAVNPTQFGGGILAGAARPAMTMNDSTTWVHGFTVGLEW